MTVCALAILAGVAACSSTRDGGAPGAASSHPTQPAQQEVLPARPVVPTYARRAVCPEAPGQMRCFAFERANEAGDFGPFASPQAAQGLTPSDLRSAYSLPSSGGNGTLVAIVDAQDYGDAESDLATYRSQFGLPPCTSQNGCFTKVNQQGQASPLPQEDENWATEIMIDLDMVSAACPDCRILLVEANSGDPADFGAAVDAAVSLGAKVVSNSYGGQEDSTTTGDEKYYDHPGVGMFVASGDGGYKVMYPAASAHVIAVGGTSLMPDQSARGWSETAWNQGSSGCSQYISKPSWQHDTGCGKRTVADIAAVGDPNTGVDIYQGGWHVGGGTSVACPIVAAAFALLGKSDASPSFPYDNQSDWYDVTSGSNGQCGGSYLCTAGPGYDGPTGFGTPNGALIASASGPGSDAGAPPPVDDAGTPPVDDAGAPPVDDAGAPSPGDAGAPPTSDAGGPAPACTPEHEPNGDLQDAQPLAPGSVCGALSSPQDVDMYTFHASSSGVPYDVSVQATGDAALAVYKQMPWGWKPVPNTSPTEVSQVSSSASGYVAVVYSPTHSMQPYTIALK